MKKKLTGYPVDMQDSESRTQPREHEELDQPAGDAVDSVDGTDLVGADAEPADELEG